MAILALVSFSSAANTVKFINHCPYDVYSWTVGPASSGFTGEDSEAVTIPANTVTTQDMLSSNMIGGGIALKLRDVPEYRIAPAGIIEVGYNLSPHKNSLSYGVSAINCDRKAGPEDPSFCPLMRGGIEVNVEALGHARCSSASCGADGCSNTLKESEACNAASDISIGFCTERVGPRTFNGALKPGYPAEIESVAKPGHKTTDGACGVESPMGATCFGFTHGNCCSCKPPFSLLPRGRVMH